MNTRIRNSAFALALIGGALLLAAPASSGSIQNDGYFGGSWNSIGPSNYEAEGNADRIGPLYGDHGFVAPVYGYVPDYYGTPAYEAPYGYEYGPAPGDTFVGRGAAFSIGME